MTDIHDTADLVSKALRRAWQLGQTYWQQADSEYQSHWKKADVTQATFDQLVEDTRAAILTSNSGAQSAPSFADAYQGAMEEVAIWKKRALEAEDLNRKFVAEINGPTYMGEQAQPAPSVPDDVIKQGLKELEAIRQNSDRDDWQPNDENLVRRLYQAMVAYGVQQAPSVPEGWLRAIDEALVITHIGVANADDSYGQAKAKLDNLIGFHVDVATDPDVNGGYKLVPIVSTDEMDNAGAYHCDGYLSAAQAVWDAMLAAAPEAKP